MAVARTIIVAGAGIGGLTAALSLAARGFRVIILEKAERLAEAGDLVSKAQVDLRVVPHHGQQGCLQVGAVHHPVGCCFGGSER